MAQPAANWNDATDGKGYWVTTPASVERLDVDWDELQETAERDPASRGRAPSGTPTEAVRRAPSRQRVDIPVVDAPDRTPVPPNRRSRAARRAEHRLPVAPLTDAALPATLDEHGFDVPEFTLSERKRSGPSLVDGPPTDLREVLDTFVPDECEEAPTEEVARPPASNVKVFARSAAFVEAITGDLPNASSAGVSIEGRTEVQEVADEAPTLIEPAPLPAEPVPSACRGEEPVSVGPVVHVRVSPDLTRPGPAPRDVATDAELSIDAKRALARAMAAKALAARAQKPRDPGSLPPVEELAPSRHQQVVLPQRSQESWSWDEADPLASPLYPERREEPVIPRTPSLSLVQSSPTTEEYDGTLATPMPAPPRPDVVVPWPLPTVRARIGQPLHAAGPELSAIDGMDSVSIERVDGRSLGEPVDTEASLVTPAPSEERSSFMGVVIGLAVAAVFLGMTAVGSFAMFALAVLIAVLG